MLVKYTVDHWEVDLSGLDSSLAVDRFGTSLELAGLHAKTWSELNKFIRHVIDGFMV